MKKYLKITLLVIIAIILVGTFVFLYQKSKPKVIVYETLAAEVTDLEKTTVATGKVEPRDEILIKPQISGIVDEVFKEAGQSVKKGGSNRQSQSYSRTRTTELRRKSCPPGRDQCKAGRNRLYPYQEVI